MRSSHWRQSPIPKAAGGSSTGTAAWGGDAKELPNHAALRNAKNPAFV